MIKKPRRSEIRPYVFAILIFMLLCTPAWSDNTILINARQAIGNNCKLGKTLPIYVELTNMGSPFKGTLEIVNSQTYPQKKERVFRKINLPSFTPKHYFLYVPPLDNSSYYSIDVGVFSGRKKIASAQIKQSNRIYKNHFFILAYSKEQAGLEYLTNPKLKLLFGKDGEIALVYPEIPYLPTSWVGYEGADLMIICNYPGLNFLPGQEKAMRDWVLSGGVLFISSSLSSGEFSQSPLKSIIPINGSPEKNGTVELAGMPALEAFCNRTPLDIQEPLLMSIVENRNGTVLLSENGNPLLLKKRYGKGMVYYFACDITKPPFKTWQGNPELWDRIYSDIITSRREVLTEETSTFISNMPEVSAPSLKNLSFFLFLYILIVGPINYWLLRRKDRMILTFITVPLIAVIFTIASFFYGYFTKGTSVLFQNTSYCQIQQAVSEAPVTSFLSLFSPGVARYDVEIGKPDAIAWEEAEPSDTKDFNLEWQDPGGMLLKDLDFDMWSMRKFRVREISHFPGTIEFDLSPQGDRIRGTIRNNLDITLKNCSILSNHRASRLFDIKKGASTIDLPLSDPLVSQFAMSSHFAGLYKFDLNTKDLDKKREQLSIISNVCTSYFARNDFSSPVIYGWSNQNISEIRLLKYHCKMQNNTFFEIE